MKKELLQLGLTDLEADVYLTLIDLGPSLAGSITKKSGIHRRSVYDATSRLIKKGLVGYMVKNNRRYFEAANPEQLYELVKEKEEAMQNIVPTLTAKYKQIVQKQETLFFSGIHGLKTIFEDQLRCGDDILVVGASGMAKELMQFYVHWFEKRRVKKKIKVRLIYNASERKKRAFKFAEVRYLPKQYGSPAAMNVYGDNVAIIHWSKEQPFAILIRNKDIALGYRNYCELLWKMAKK